MSAPTITQKELKEAQVYRKIPSKGPPLDKSTKVWREILSWKNTKIKDGGDKPLPSPPHYPHQDKKWNAHGHSILPNNVSHRSQNHHNTPPSQSQRKAVQECIIEETLPKGSSLNFGV